MPSNLENTLAARWLRKFSFLFYLGTYSLAIGLILIVFIVYPDAWVWSLETADILIWRTLPIKDSVDVTIATALGAGALSVALDFLYSFLDLGVFIFQ